MKTLTTLITTLVLLTSVGEQEEAVTETVISTCFRSVVRQMSDGSVSGAATALGCITLSGYCVAGIVVGCATMEATKAIKESVSGSSGK